MVLLNLGFVFATALAAPPQKLVPYGKVVAAQNVTLAGTPLKTGDSIDREGVLESAANGKAKIQLNASKTLLQINGATSIILVRGEPNKTLELVLNRGRLKTKVGEHAKTTSPIFRIRTRSAVMGVRGTEFLSVYTPLLDESEVVVFDGEVELQSNSDASDHKLIPKGHWGGVGGRYGKRIGELIHLNEDALDTFDKASRVD